jgi:hypothetical protein
LTVVLLFQPLTCTCMRLPTLNHGDSSNGIHLLFLPMYEYGTPLASRPCLTMIISFLYVSQETSSFISIFFFFILGLALRRQPIGCPLCSLKAFLCSVLKVRQSCCDTDICVRLTSCTAKKMLHSEIPILSIVVLLRVNAPASKYYILEVTF